MSATLKPPHRVMIIGPSGAGKSTLARAIGQRLAIPAVHLDVLFWQPGWVESDDASFRARIVAAIAGEAWVIDGNYSRFFDIRLARATCVIWLDLPRRLYFPRSVWRMVKNYGRERGDIGPGCPERLDIPFFRDWVWAYPRRTRAKHRALMAELPATTTGITLTSRAEVAAFVSSLDIPPCAPRHPA